MVDNLTCVIDEDVEPLLSLEEVLTELPYRVQVGQVQLHVMDVQVVTPELDLPRSFLGLVHVSAGNDDMGASHRHGNSCVLANTTVPTYKNSKFTLFVVALVRNMQCDDLKGAAILTAAVISIIMSLNDSFYLSINFTQSSVSR